MGETAQKHTHMSHTKTLVRLLQDEIEDMPMPDGKRVRMCEALQELYTQEGDHESESEGDGVYFIPNEQLSPSDDIEVHNAALRKTFHVKPTDFSSDALALITTLWFDKRIQRPRFYLVVKSTNDGYEMDDCFLNSVSWRTWNDLRKLICSSIVSEIKGLLKNLSSLKEHIRISEERYNVALKEYKILTNILEEFTKESAGKTDATTLATIESITNEQLLARAEKNSHKEAFKNYTLKANNTQGQVQALGLVVVVDETTDQRLVYNGFIKPWSKRLVKACWDIHHMCNLLSNQKADAPYRGAPGSAEAAAMSFVQLKLSTLQPLEPLERCSTLGPNAWLVRLVQTGEETVVRMRAAFKEMVTLACNPDEDVYNEIIDFSADSKLVIEVVTA